jgi:hypothetical protein
MPILSKANDWGGGSISHDLYKHIQEILPEGKTILELGSGWGSSKLMGRWNLYSIEDREKWFKMFNPQSFLFPLVDAHDKWYDLELMKSTLRGLKYDLLLIDGPRYGRKNFPANLDLFDMSVSMVFDDVKRKEGQTVIEEVSLLVGRPYKIWHKSFGVIQGENDGQ